MSTEPNETLEISDSAPSETRALYVVGIGASAGGLAAIEQLFDNMPAETGMAFVIVQHLSPDFKSLMDELLSRHTSMPIHRVEDGMLVEADHIYLIPPKKNMVLSQGRLLLTDQDNTGAINLPIDIFFRSLAQDIGRYAVAIILSGTGSDGSRGIQEIHDAGGLVLTQDLDSADFDGMPRSAASTQIVDVVCPPEEMPKKIAQYVFDPSDFVRGQVSEPKRLDQVGVLFEIFRLFRHKFGIDFSLYKAATIDRRIERRLQITRTPTMRQYVQQLHDDPQELDLLYRDLLVEVTQFFRDPEAFNVIRREVVPQLIENAAPRRELRVWVPGCATGEEAYSLAMIFDDALTNSGAEDDISVKVFATDVHRRSLEYASAGVYTPAAVENVPSEFRAKYFTSNGDLHHVVRELRQTVIFAPNDITKDPPFTKMDLISCRNVLIYLEPHVQKKALSLFHFGLRTDGVLMLGPSETLGELSAEFETIDRHWRIYMKQRDVRLPMAGRLPMTPALSKVVAGRAPFVADAPIRDGGFALSGACDELLAKYVPPSLLVNEFFELVHSFGDARQILVQPEGRPTLDVLKLVQGDLRMALSAALHKASQERTNVVYKGVRVRHENGDRQFKVVVEPYSKGNERMFLICLEPIELPQTPGASEEEFDAQEQSTERITVLEQELSYTRESLQSTVEELETSNEELQSTNEELIASNEELQSTNEELHSVNEELYTVNAEHKQKIEELTQMTTDMDNLLKSTEIATIFLDRELRIRMFTPAISSVFCVLEQDIGRPIDHIACKLRHPDLMADLRKVIANGQAIEGEASSSEGETFLQRTRAYRSAQGEVDGIVMTFTNVSAIKKHNSELLRANQDLQGFAYAVSHDLQAPLRHIVSGCQRLEEGLPASTDPEHLACVGQISASSSKLKQLIKGLLTYSRVNTRGKNFVRTEADTALELAIEDLQTEIEENDAQLTRAEMPVIQADNVQIQRVFLELIKNAINYRDDRPLEISINAESRIGEWLFSVADNGIGIEERHRDRIFVIFQRLGLKPEVPGDGLGLSLCKRIIERHGGRIYAESGPGGGTRFCFTIPA